MLPADSAPECDLHQHEPSMGNHKTLKFHLSHDFQNLIPDD